MKGFATKAVHGDLHTKYISGGATTVGGLIIDYGTFDWEDCARLEEDAGKIGQLSRLEEFEIL